MISGAEVLREPQSTQRSEKIKATRTQETISGMRYVAGINTCKTTSPRAYVFLMDAYAGKAQLRRGFQSRLYGNVVVQRRRVTR